MEEGQDMQSYGSHNDENCSFLAQNVLHPDRYMIVYMALHSARKDEWLCYVT